MDTSSLKYAYALPCEVVTFYNFALPHKVAGVNSTAADSLFGNSKVCRFLKEYQIINTLPKIAGFQSLEHFSKPLTQPTEIPNFVA